MILSQALPGDYATTKDVLQLQTTMNIGTKLKHLEVKQSNLKVKKEQAYIIFSKLSKYIPLYYYNNS